jgi:cytochrome P450
MRVEASIFISPYVTQRNPRYFERPENFEPERWENIDIPKFAYFPFGGGAKMCIGEPFARMEGLMVLATLAQKWRLERINETPVGIGSGTVLNPDQPMLMRPVRIPASTNVLHLRQQPPVFDPYQDTVRCRRKRVQ